MVLFFDDFETDQGWLFNPAGTDTAGNGVWERGNPEETNYNGLKQLGNTVSGSHGLVTGLLAGSNPRTYDLDGGVTTVRSPNIGLPAGADLTLSFSYYLAHHSNASSADYLRVIVVGNSSQIVFEEVGATDNDDAAWATFTTDLSSFAGQTVYLLISAADLAGESLVEAAVDDVRIEAAGGGGPTPTPGPTVTPPPAGNLFFDDFETDQGWVVNPNDTDTATSGFWERGNPEETSEDGLICQLGTTVSGSYALVTGAAAGTDANANDIDNGITSIRSPNITLPTGGNITLSLSYYLAHLANARGDYLRITVVGENNSVVVFQQTAPPGNVPAAWTTFSTSLNGFAGQTVYLLIDAGDIRGASLVEAAIEDVSIDFAP